MTIANIVVTNQPVDEDGTHAFVHVRLVGHVVGIHSVLTLQLVEMLVHLVNVARGQQRVTSVAGVNVVALTVHVVPTVIHRRAGRHHLRRTARAPTTHRHQRKDWLLRRIVCLGFLPRPVRVGDVRQRPALARRTAALLVYGRLRYVRSWCRIPTNVPEYRAHGAIASRKWKVCLLSEREATGNQQRKSQRLVFCRFFSRSSLSHIKGNSILAVFFVVEKTFETQNHTQNGPPLVRAEQAAAGQVGRMHRCVRFDVDADPWGSGENTVGPALIFF